MDPWQKSAQTIKSREDAEKRLRELRAVSDILSLPREQWLHALGDLIDLSEGFKDHQGTLQAVAWIEVLDQQALEPETQALLCYFASNAWSDLQAIRRQADQAVWSWNQEEFGKRIVYLRRARESPGFSSLSPFRRAQALTNLGNVLSTLGRPIAALAVYDDALVQRPSHAMASANKALAIIHYSQQLYDQGHQLVMLRVARDLLSTGLAGDIEPHARQPFVERAAWTNEILNQVPADVAPEHREYSIGDTNDERDYRRWCLDRRLFLNPLNDVNNWTVAARDVIAVPNMVRPLSEGPSFHGFFNQLKQEYVCARYHLWAASEGAQPTFVDRDVFLLDTLDYPIYGVAIENAKVSFRMAYSLLDKAAVFLNDYLALGMAKDAVTFRNMWFHNGNAKQGLNQRISDGRNNALRGLYWLSKDLFEKSPQYADVLEPTARRLVDVRNHLEHKYLKVHDMIIDGPSWTRDALALSVTRVELESKAVHVLRLAREVILYLCMAIHVNERQERAATQVQGKIMPVALGPYEMGTRRSVNPQ